MFNIVSFVLYIEISLRIVKFENSCCIMLSIPLTPKEILIANNIL